MKLSELEELLTPMAKTAKFAAAGPAYAHHHLGAARGTSATVVSSANLAPGSRISSRFGSATNIISTAPSGSLPAVAASEQKLSLLGTQLSSAAAASGAGVSLASGSPPDASLGTS